MIMLRHSSVMLVGVGLLCVIGVSVSMFVIINYEPINSVGFLGLLALMGVLMRNSFADKTIRVFRCLSRVIVSGNTSDQSEHITEESK
jgi:hypothetical protein